MKTYSFGGVFLLFLPSFTFAAGEAVRSHPSSGDGPAVVMSISVDDGEPRSAMRLRDALRQSHDESDEAGKPFRLSVEERQRMREQLRSRSPYDNPKK